MPRRSNVPRASSGRRRLLVRDRSTPPEAAMRLVLLVGLFVSLAVNAAAATGAPQRPTHTRVLARMLSLDWMLAFGMGQRTVFAVLETFRRKRSR